MSKTELRITHSNGGRNLGHFRALSSGDVITIGSSKSARIRVRSSRVDDIHASIENRNGVWTIVDLASTHGTWVGKDQVNESAINGKVQITFGDDTLTIEPCVVKPYNLFREQNRLIGVASPNMVERQQIVVMRGNGEVVSTTLTEKNKPIDFKFNRKKHTFTPATSLDWIEDQVGDLWIKRRLVRTEIYENERPKNILGYFPKDLVRPFGLALAITLFVFLSAWLMPKIMPKDPGALDRNKYTRMLIDPEVIQKQQKKAEELKKQTEIKKAVEVKKPETTRVVEKTKQVVEPVTPEAKKVVNTIKESGLSDKISNVVAAAAVDTNSLLEGAGKGVGNSRNRAFASEGVAVKGATLSKNAGAYNVSGITTNGVAGGTAVSGKLGGLSVGGVGAGGLVDAIEEETEISGGLDPNIISQVVKNNLGRVRYCYERQLAAEPALYGKIKIAWTIAADGTVSTQKVEQSTMANAMVEGCILRQVAKWTFPRPDGGGDVVVAYPFYFKANK